jgi:hypothetical protein
MTAVFSVRNAKPTQLTVQKPQPNARAVARLPAQDRNIASNNAPAAGADPVMTLPNP